VKCGASAVEREQSMRAKQSGALEKKPAGSIPVSRSRFLKQTRN